MEFNIENLSKCKNVTECSKLLGYHYYNAWVQRKLIDACNKIGFDLWSHLESVKKLAKLTCLNCGALLKRRQYKFCSRSCSAQFNNKLRRPSLKTKEKIRESVIKYHQNHPEAFRKFVESGKQASAQRSKNYDLALERLGYSKHRICPTCGKEFIARKHSTIYCSRKCVSNSPEYKNRLKQIQLERVKQGIHSGWQSRNITSYPEKFWIKVLQNNNIPFEREKHVGQYFLDFVISINNKLIDLEIDGKQHKYQDRQLSDQIRDQFLSENGYHVYRIEWNEINSIKGKNIMKDKIEKFINYISTL